MTTITGVRRSLAVACAVLVIGCCSGSALAVSHYPKTTFGPEGMALQRGTPLAAAPTLSGAPVAGIRCTRPTTTFHVHIHLAIYVFGRLRPLPATIGMVAPYEKPTPTGPFYNARTCYYSLHTHAQDGVIHVEGPAPKVYRLGQFFALWGQPLTGGRVGDVIAPLRVLVNGQPSAMAPGLIPLRNRGEIQIDVGTVVPLQPVNWSHF